MPRVNRDLQRRMAQRRERERRRPSPDRQYSFGTAQRSPTAAEEAVGEAPAHITPSRTPPRSTVQAPFSSYRAEYAYVLHDLRRVGLVIGSLLLILILLYLILPH